MNDGEDMPGYGVGGEKVAKEAGDVAEAVRFVAVDGAVVLQQVSATSDQCNSMRGTYLLEAGLEEFSP